MVFSVDDETSQSGLCHAESLHPVLSVKNFPPPWVFGSVPAKTDAGEFDRELAQPGRCLSGGPGKSSEQPAPMAV